MLSGHHRADGSGDGNFQGPYREFLYSLLLSLWFIRTCFFVFTALAFAFFFPYYTTQTSMPPAGFEPETSRFVAQCLSQQHHCYFWWTKWHPDRLLSGNFGVTPFSCLSTSAPYLSVLRWAACPLESCSEIIKKWTVFALRWVWVVAIKSLSAEV